MIMMIISIVVVAVVVSVIESQHCQPLPPATAPATPLTLAASHVAVSCYARLLTTNIIFATKLSLPPQTTLQRQLFS